MTEFNTIIDKILRKCKNISIGHKDVRAEAKKEGEMAGERRRL